MPESNNLTMRVEVRTVDISIRKNGGSSNAQITLTYKDCETQHPIDVYNIDAVMVLSPFCQAHLTEGILTYRGYCLIVEANTKRNGNGDYLLVVVSEKVQEI